jgi:hypothetical protein
VGDDEAWPKELEHALQAEGVNVEVANLGLPGASPYDYQEIADRALRVLAPDIVLVGVLQGDDAAQMLERGRLWRARLHDLFPNLTAAAGAWQRRRSSGSEDVREDWRARAAIIPALLTPAQRQRFDAYEPQVREAFAAGELNPDLVYQALKHQDDFHRSVQQPAQVDIAVARLSHVMRRITDDAARHQARTAVVSVPFGVFVSQLQYGQWTRYGFTLDPRMLTSNAADAAARLAAAAAGIPVFAATDAFRRASAEPLFFRLDGHLTARGHRLLASVLARPLAEWIKRGD